MMQTIEEKKHFIWLIDLGGVVDCKFYAGILMTE